MVDLNLPRQRLITTEAPQERLSARDYQSANDSIATGLRKLGQGAEDIAVPLAEKQGKADAAAAIVTDENGNPKVLPAESSFILGNAGNAYANAKESALMAGNRSEIDKALIDLRQKYPNDPQSFQKEATAYLQTRRDANVNGLGNETFSYGVRVATGHYSGLVEGKASADVDMARRELDNRESVVIDRMDQLARDANGGTSSEAFRDLQAELKDIRDRKQANPRLRYSPELRALDDESTQKGLTAAAVVGRYRQRYIDTGNLPLVQREAETELRGLGLGEAQTQKYLGQVNQHLAGQNAIKSVEKDELRQEVRGNIDGIGQNGPLDDKTFESLSSRLRSNKMHAELTNLVNAQVGRQALDSIKYGTPEEAAKAIDWLKQKRVEAATEAAVRSRSLVAYGGVNTRGIKSDVQERVAGLQQQAEAAGVPFTVTSGFRDPEHNARVGGASGSQHIHGNAVDIKLPDDPEKARKLVSLIAASGVPGMGYYPNSNSIHIDYRATGAATWGADYSSGSIGRGGDPEVWRLITSRSITPTAPRQNGEPPIILKGAVEAAQSAYNERAKAAFADVKQAFENNFVPQQSEIDTFSALAERVSDPKLAEEMRMFVQKEGFEQKFGAQSTAQMRASVQNLRLQGQAGNLDRTGRELAVRAETMQAERIKALQDDPIGTGMKERGFDPELRKIAPLDTQTPGAIAANFAARQRLLNVVGKTEPQAAKVALQPNEIPAFKAQWDASSLDEKSRMLGEMAQSLDGPTLTATMGKIVKTDESATLLAGAGVIMQQNPILGRSLLSGQMAIDSGMVKGIKGNDVVALFMQKIMPATTFPEGTKHWGMYRELAEARYADLSRAANDQTGVINDKRLQQAVNDVTGGLISYGSLKVVAPWPGATSSDFRAAVNGITPKDLEGAFYGKGARATPEEIKSTANFQSVGNGKYVPFFGSNPTSGFVKVRRPDGSEGRLIIDLGAKKGLKPALPSLSELPDVPMMGFQ